MVTDLNAHLVGKRVDSIDVRLSYKIVELFSEGLYSSPSKAVEELVVNSFDAGARKVHVLLSPDMHSKNAAIAVIDDGEGMGVDGLKQHWLIGTSNKRDIKKLPLNRKQIGKFGIGKLATYVLANCLTHISKRNGKYHLTSMDYRNIGKHVNREVEPKTPIKIDLMELTNKQARRAIDSWVKQAELSIQASVLFGKDSPNSWTVSIMSELKQKVHEIKPGKLKWILRTALPLRRDFSIRLNAKKLTSSQAEKGMLKRLTIGKELVKLQHNGLEDVEKYEDAGLSKNDERRFGIRVPGLGPVTGYAEAYGDLLTGKADRIGRSHGFFVYVYDRLINIDDGHFGIPPNKLKHGIFGRFRLVVHMDSLDERLRSNRESIEYGPLRETAQNVLLAIFNTVRPEIENHDRGEKPWAKLTRSMASSPPSLSRRPIIDLVRNVMNKRAKTRYLIVPDCPTASKQSEFLSELEKRVQNPEKFVTGVECSPTGSQNDGIVKYNTESGVLFLNESHPFVAVFHDEFTRRSAQPLELLAMAEVLIEAQLHFDGVDPTQIDDFLSERDRLLRHMAGESGHTSVLFIANALSEARNNPCLLEKCVCDAFRSLGFDVVHDGRSNQPDGIATAYLSGGEDDTSQKYTVCLEAKSKRNPDDTVSAKDVRLAAVIRHSKTHKCDHAVVVGPAFPTSAGDESALAKEIEDGRRSNGYPKTITLITVDDLAELVKLRPVKRLGLKNIRNLFLECTLPAQSSDWIRTIRKSDVESPQYSKIIRAISKLQRDFHMSTVKYASLRTELLHSKPPIKYETDSKLMEICKTMQQMAPGAIWAGEERVELDQSAENAIAAIKDFQADVEKTA